MPSTASYPDGGPPKDVTSVYELATRTLGSQEAAKIWLNSPQLGLGGNRPVDLLTTESGREQVETLLLRLEHGVYT